MFHEDITQSRSEKHYWKMIVWHLFIYNFQGLLRKILFCWHLKSLKSMFKKNSHFFAPFFKVTPKSHFSLFLSMIFNELILFRANLVSITQTFRNEFNWLHEKMACLNNKLVSMNVRKGSFSLKQSWRKVHMKMSDSYPSKTFSKYLYYFLSYVRPH